MCMDGQFFQPGTLQYDITLPTPTKTKMAALRIWTNVQSWRSSLRPRNSVTCASRAPEVSPIIVSPVSCPRKSCYFTNTNMAVASDRKEKVWPYWQLELRNITFQLWVSVSVELDLTCATVGVVFFIMLLFFSVHFYDKLRLSRVEKWSFKLKNIMFGSWCNSNHMKKQYHTYLFWNKVMGQQKGRDFVSLSAA